MPGVLRLDKLVLPGFKQAQRRVMQKWQKWKHRHSAVFQLNFVCKHAYIYTFMAWSLYKTTNQKWKNTCLIGYWLVRACIILMIQWMYICVVFANGHSLEDNTQCLRYCDLCVILGRKPAMDSQFQLAQIGNLFCQAVMYSFGYVCSLFVLHAHLFAPFVQRASPFLWPCELLV